MLLLETVINRYLALDPEALHKIAAFKGRVIKLEITGINRSLYMLPDDDGISVRLDMDDVEPDTVLRGSPASLFRMGLASNVTNMLLRGEVEITGDTRLGHQFKNVFNRMDIDWSEPLAQVFGDAIANQMVEAGKKLFGWASDSAESVTRSVGEYLQEESRDVVSETEINMFCRNVDSLRDDVDRLEARMQQLSANQQTGSSS